MDNKLKDMQLTDENIVQIKQAFTDEGYRLRINFGEEVLTGSQWYERFEKIVKEDAEMNTSINQIKNHFLIAAKKASGLL